MESIFNLANSQGASPFSSSQVNALPSGGNGQWSQRQKSGQTGSPYEAFINQLKTRAQWSRRNGSGAMPSRGSGTGQSILPWTGGQAGMSSTTAPGDQKTTMPLTFTQPYTPNGPTGMPTPPPVNRLFARETPQGADGGQYGAMWHSSLDENGNWVRNPGIGGGTQPGSIQGPVATGQGAVGTQIPDYSYRVIDQSNGGGDVQHGYGVGQGGGGQVATQGPVATQPTPQGDNIVGQNQGNPIQQQYNDAGMGGSYIGSSQNAHVDVSKLPKALQMLASYGVPLTPALIAAVTGQSLPPADPARAFQARGGGILPSYQTFGQMSPDERELFQSYTMGPVGLPWNNTAAAMQAPTANFRSAVRAY